MTTRTTASRRPMLLDVLPLLAVTLLARPAPAVERIRDLPNDLIDRSGVSLLDLPMAGAIAQAAANAFEGKEIRVALLDDVSFKINDCLGIKGSAGEFHLRFGKADLTIDSSGLEFELFIEHVSLTAIDIKMKPRVPTWSNPNPCGWSGKFEVGGSASDVRIRVRCAPKVSLDDCRIVSLGDFDASVSIGGINLKPLQNNLDSVAKDLIEESVNLALDALFPDFLRDVLGGAVLAQICQGKYAIYQTYMAFLGAGVSLHSLPDVYVEEIQPIFPHVDLRSVRFGFSNRQPSDNATTDCDKIYFNDAAYVERLRRAELSTPEEWDWLLHELRHTEQCRELGGRQAYAERWFRDLEISLLVTRLANPAQYFTWLHDNMPMEADADSRASGTVVVTGEVTGAPAGDAVVVALPAGSSPEAPAAARSTVDGGGYELFLRSGAYDVWVRPAAGAPVLVEESLDIVADEDGDGLTDVVDLDLSAAGSTVSDQPEFLRGDSNANDRADLSDALFTLGWLFGDGPAPVCEKAADVNDDGRVDISDSMRLLGYLFLGGPAPAAPFPVAGQDPTEDGLSCGASPTA
ncbi:MAG TPA: hypothetical protein VMT52_08410 [Planctomycetota bacterium]|nr:hypothetical protein [Planctomycetota bacterium]